MSTFITLAPLIGLLFFFVFFVSIAIWAMLPSNKTRLQTHADIPTRENPYDRT
jgi:cbb3-type cytochrome oxidase subunit 3